MWTSVVARKTCRGTRSKPVSLDKLDGTPYHVRMDELNWRQKAHCALECADTTLSPNDWYAEEHTTEAAIASAVCFGCPVRRECLKEACDNSEPHGIWGGLPFSIRNSKGQVHNYLKLVDLPDPYETDDTHSPFHISNWLGVNDERE